MVEFTLNSASLDAIDANMALLGRKVTDKITIAVLKEVTDPILKWAIDFCPVGDQKTDVFAGLLKRSIDRKIKNVKSKGTCIAIIGPARKRGVETGHNTGMGTGNKKIPTRYAHWQEFGTSHSAPKPFMRPAWDMAGGEHCLERFLQRFGEMLEEEVGKLPQNSTP